MLNHKVLLALEAKVMELVLAALDHVAKRLSETVLAAGDPIDGHDLQAIQRYWNEVAPQLAEDLAAIYTTVTVGTATALAGDNAVSAIKVRQLQERYLREATDRLGNVGADLWREATDTLARGVAEGEGYDDLRARLVQAFAEGGKQLGESRATRIARTEVQSAVNHGSFDAASGLQGDSRPQYKQWVSTLDDRTRPEHEDADGQVVPIDEAFVVGDEELMYPGDENASPENTINCRCTTIYVDSPDGADNDNRQYLSADDFSVLTPDLGTAEQDNDVDQMLVETVTAADSGDHAETGMIALVPSDVDAQRLAMPDGDPPEKLHVTLCFLGDTADWPSDATDRLTNLCAALAADTEPLHVEAWNASIFNPNDEEPCWVLGIGRDGGEDGRHPLQAMYAHAQEYGQMALGDLPEQHSPWVPHLTLTYTADTSPIDDVVQRCGPLTLDRLRLSTGARTQDFPLTGATMSPQPEEPAMTAARPHAFGQTITAADIATPPGVVFTTSRIRGVTLVDIPAFTEARIAVTGPADENGMVPWAGPITLENTPTGDGRFWQPGAFTWDPEALGAIRWDVQDEGEHYGAVCVGKILSITRDGDQIMAQGVFDTTVPEGAMAAALTERGTLGGVSVDLDDIPEDSVEMNLMAAVCAATDLPLAPDDQEWDEAAAGQSVLELATQDDGSVDVSIIAAACLWIADDADPADPGSYQLLFAANIDGTLTAVPNGLRAAEQNLPALGLTDTENQEVLAVINGYLGATDGAPTAADEVALLQPEIEASAWGQFKELPPLPAAAFREPTPEELPTDDGPVHVMYASGRIWGWVAQRGVCHDGVSGSCLKPPLDKVDLSTFLRSRVKLDDGATITAGVFTMGTGHHNDGAEAASEVALFDDTRTVAGIVTCGVNDRGMWFSGVAAPWLSDWDRRVFASCAPSGHWRRLRSGQWSLRAVLTVPVPGFPTRLVASAVQRSNIAIETEPPHEDEPGLPVRPERSAIEILASAVVDEMERRQSVRELMAEAEAVVAAARVDVARHLALNEAEPTPQSDEPATT